jgi:hypothetical protein
MLHAISLWKNKESKQLESKEFLKQFNKAQKPTDPFQIGKDITPAPGAEKASQSVATAAKRGWLMFREVFGKKDDSGTSTESTAPHDTSKDSDKGEEGGGNHSKD